MLSRKVKEMYYTAAGPLMKANGWWYRLVRAPRAGTVKVHLGPGQQRYIAGWINVDANMFTAKCDVWADLRHPLPFPESTVTAIYSYHVIEHLPDLESHFRETFRCLKPGGVFRVGGPNGDSAIRKYIEGNSGWFDDFPIKRRSLGGRFENFIFCRGEHLTILTPTYLRELAEDAGFVDIAVCRPIEETAFPWAFGSEILSTEWERSSECPHTLVIEGRKPGDMGDSRHES